MTAKQQRIVARRARGFVRQGVSVSQAAEHCEISRAYYYRLVHDLEAFEQAHPAENHAEWQAEYRQRLDRATAMVEAGDSAQVVADATELLLSDVLDLKEKSNNNDPLFD